MASGNDTQTPEWILDHVRQVGPIAWDPCSTPSYPCGADALATRDDEPDGLSASWVARSKGGLTWCNPPFGRGLMELWAAKIVLEAGRGAEIIALTRGDLSTRWARQLTLAAQLVAFPPRIRFRGATNSPNFSNSIFYFGPRPQTFRAAFEDLGPIVQPISKPTNKKAK